MSDRNISTDPAGREFTIAFAIQIGAYTLEPSSRPGWMWVMAGGEGGEFEVAKLEAVIAKFYEENF